MRWRLGRKSQNIEDRRGRRAGLRLPGGLGRGRSGGRRTLGGGIGVIILALIAMAFGVDPRLVLSMLDGGQMVTTERSFDGAPPSTTGDDKSAFVAAVLGETEVTWNEIFKSLDLVYEEPTLVLFDGSVQSACGFASAASGPFYCPGDSKVYLDTSFFQELEQRLGASGDFAQAYVIAHEIGHHVQNQLGIAGKVNELRRTVSQADGNQLSVRLELQADCFAGVWAHSIQDERQLLEQGDLEEALTAASAIGDDRLQRQSQGYVVPESFTHGTSAQRTSWFSQGLESGSVQRCDTFSGPLD